MKDFWPGQLPYEAANGFFFFFPLGRWCPGQDAMSCPFLLVRRSLDPFSRQMLSGSSFRIPVFFSGSFRLHVFPSEKYRLSSFFYSKALKPAVFLLLFNGNPRLFLYTFVFSKEVPISIQVKGIRILRTCFLFRWIGPFSPSCD